MLVSGKGWLAGLALALFMPRVLTNDAENVLPLDDAARFTLPLDGCSNFHESVRLTKLVDLRGQKIARGARLPVAGSRCVDGFDLILTPG